MEPCRLRRNSKEAVLETESSVDECDVRRLKQVVVKQEFHEFSSAAGQFPAEIVAFQQFEHIGDAGQPGNRLAGFSSKNDVSGQKLCLIFDGFNIVNRLVDVTGIRL